MGTDRRGFIIEVHGPFPTEDGRYVVRATIDGDAVACETFSEYEDALGCRKFLESSITRLR